MGNIETYCCKSLCIIALDSKVDKSFIIKSYNLEENE